MLQHTFKRVDDDEANTINNDMIPLDSCGVCENFGIIFLFYRVSS